jgi:hypothetical protein
MRPTESQEKSVPNSDSRSSSFRLIEEFVSGCRYMGSWNYHLGKDGELGRGRRVSMEASRNQRIAELKERIFLLQIEERRFYAVLTSPRRNEELRAQARKGLKESRDALDMLTKELMLLSSEP